MIAPLHLMQFSQNLARRLRGASLVWALVASLACSWAAHAQSIVTDYAAANMSNTALKLEELAVLRDVNPKLRLPDILAGRGGEFVPQTSLNIHDSGWDDSDFWLRLTLQGIALPAGQSARSIHLLEFPKSFLDDIRMYSPPMAGEQAWRVQAAGDFLAPQDWFVRGLHPRFLLPRANDLLASPEGKQVLYVRISHIVPMTVRMQINSAAQSSEIAQASFLGLGLALGAMLFTAVLSLSLALLNKDSIFAWYCVYVLTSGLANASYSGIAHLLIWPVSGFWPGTAALFWLLLSLGCQLQFCRVLFQSHSTRRWPSRTAVLLGALCAITAVLFALMPQRWRLFYFLSFALLILSAAVVTPLVYWVWRRGNRLALAWLIAFVPLFCTVIWALLDGVGLVHSAANFNLPIYATALEVIMLGMALQWFARERHGQKEREKTLAAIDPLTGFATVDAFQTRLLRDWHSQKTNKQDLAVAYIALKTKAVDKKHMQQMLMRTVRVLRSATEANDMVARLEGQLMAVVMPNVPMDDQLSQRLSRIVALGLMLDRSDPQTTVLQFRIAATTFKSFKKPLAQLDTQLRELLAEPAGWGSKPIRYIDHNLMARTTGQNMNDSFAMEELWDQALKRQLQDAKTLPPS